MFVLPARGIVLGDAAAAFGEAGIADFALAGKHQTARGEHGFDDGGAGLARDALVALAMVVGTDIKEGVVLAVVPTDKFVLLAHKGEEATRASCTLAVAQHLVEEPTARHYGVGAEEFERSGRLHLRTDDADEILLHGQFVDDNEHLLFDNDTQRAAEGLRFAALPVELLADGHIFKGKGARFVFGRKGEFAIEIAVPEDTTVATLCRLAAAQGITLGDIVLVEGKGDMILAHNAHTDCGLFGKEFAVVVVDSIGTARARGGMEFAGNLVHFAVGHCHLAEDGDGPLGCETAEVLFARRDEQAAHIQCAWADEHLRFSLGKIAIGAVLAAWEKHHHNAVAIHRSTLLSPSEEVHIGFALSLGYGKDIEQLAKNNAFLVLAVTHKHEGGTGIAMQTIDTYGLRNESVLLEFGLLLPSQGIDFLQSVLVEFPIALQGNYTPVACLQMGMVGSGCAATRSVVEEEEVGHRPGQAVHLAEEERELLQLMAARGDGQMVRQDGEGIHQHLVLSIEGQGYLLGWAVAVAEEAGAFPEIALIYLGCCRDDAARVELYGKGMVFGGEFAGLNVAGQFLEPLLHLCPSRHLLIEETEHVLLARRSVPPFEHRTARFYLYGAQAVLVEVVAVDLVQGKGRIGVAFPAAAEVEFVKDSANAVAAREGQPQGIVLAVGSIGETDLAEDVCAEGARRTEAIDAQGIVAAIVGGPFLMGNQSRRQGVELEVHHAIRANNHSGLLLVEGFDNACQRGGTAIQVVGIQLHGISAAGGMTNGKVPATANAEVAGFGDEMYNALVGEGTDGLGRAIGGVVINDNHVEIERCFLLEDAADGIGDGALAVSDGNNYGSLHGILGLIVRKVVVFIWSQPGTDALEVFGAGALVFELHLAVGGIHIVKLYLAALAQVGLDFGI